MLGYSPSLGSDLQCGAQTLCSAAEPGLFCGDRVLAHGGPIHSCLPLAMLTSKYRFVEQLICSHLCASAVGDIENVKAMSLPPALPSQADRTAHRGSNYRAVKCSAVGLVEEKFRGSSQESSWRSGSWAGPRRMN